MVKNFNNMTLNEMVIFLRKSNDDEIVELINNKDFISELSLQNLNVLFLNIKDDYKKILLDDKIIFDRIMSIPLNRVKKTILDLVSDNIREYIYNSSHLNNSINGKKIVELHLKKLSPEELTKLLSNENLKKIYKIDIVDYVNKKFKLDNYLKDLLNNNINNFNSLALFKIKNEIELLIYTKFNILVNTNNLLFINDIKLDYDFLKNVNRKHINSLVNMLKNKDKVINDNMVFISAIKLYMIFGLDNSKKIINDFFTYATDASLKRTSFELFKENRREYRLKNQNKFYYHDMEEDFLDALNNMDINFFKNFCLDTSDEYINNLIEETKSELLYLSKLEKLKKIKEIIDLEIYKREKYYENLDIKKYLKYYKESSRKKKISYIDIYNIFSYVDIPYVLNREGKLIINKDLNDFLLGNYKKDNDCLLRMVFNNHAFGLNRELYNIINNFEKIREMIKKQNEAQDENIDDEKQKNLKKDEKKSNQEYLSLNSISDVIDISKVFLYNLKPNEMDITLETLSKILNSRKYCTENPEIILKRILKLHVQRKKKIASAVEKVKGEFENVKYELKDFDSEDLLACGIDSGSCFKVGGKGEDLFNYCLTDPKGLVFYIKYNNTKYVLPATINGNMLNINSIDPVIEDNLIFTKIMNTINHFCNEIINTPDNKIELATITDIHLNDYFENSNYKPIYFKEALPLGANCYCDYNKKEVTNYIISKKDSSIEPKYFINTDVFLEKRSIPYVLSPNNETDKERISIRINSIAYSNIDYLDISEEKKKKEKSYYIEKDINDYIYIVGNKDWYIGIKKDRTIDKYILPYDVRAIDEFNSYISIIEEELMISKKKIK